MLVGTGNEQLAGGIDTAQSVPVTTTPDVWSGYSVEIGPKLSEIARSVLKCCVYGLGGVVLLAGVTVCVEGITAQGPTPTPTMIPVPGPTPIPTLGYESNCPIILKGYPSISSQGGQDGLPEEGQGGVELDGYSGMPIPVPIPGADSLSQ